MWNALFALLFIIGFEQISWNVHKLVVKYNEQRKGGVNIKRLVLLLVLLAALTGCSRSITGNANITGLLSAPKRSETESEIVQAIGDYLEENITLKYSSSQGYTAPIQLIDVTGDKTNEAVVFYYASNKGTNIRFAVLEYREEKWNIVFDREGLGSDVFYFETVEFPEMAGKQIIVGYLPNSISENFFVTYFTGHTEIEEDYMEVCEDIAMNDVNNDGYKDILLTSHQTDGKLRIKALTMMDESGYKILGTKIVRRGDVDITQMKFFRNEENRTVIYIDYRDSANRIYTEAFAFEDSSVVNCICQDAVSRLWPYENNLNSFDMDNDGTPEIPTVVEEIKEPSEEETEPEEPAVNRIVKWTDYSGQEPVYKCYGVYNTQSNLFMTMPEEWQGYISFESGMSAFKVVSQNDGEALVTVKETDVRDSVKNSDYSYTIRRGAKSWDIEFSHNVDLAQIEYMIKGIAVFD